MPPLFLGCYWLDPFFLNEVWHWHIGLRWAIVALWATCFLFRQTSCWRVMALFSSPEPKAHWWAYSIGRHPSYAVSTGHMTKVAAMPIYGKNLKNLLLRNQKANDHETWYAALGTQVLPNSFKLTMTYFLRQGQIWSLMLWYGKKVKPWISQKLLLSLIWN